MKITSTTWNSWPNGAAFYSVEIWEYCLTPNHVQLVTMAHGVFVITVMDTGTKSSCRVTYPRKKLVARRAFGRLVSLEAWVSLRQESSRKEEVTRTQKPFVATLRVNESRPAELGQQPEASFAWGGGTLTAKRKQRVPMPCYRAPKYSLQEPPL